MNAEVVCGSCGATVVRGAFCRRCGKPLPKGAVLQPVADEQSEPVEAVATTEADLPDLVDERSHKRAVLLTLSAVAALVALAGAVSLVLLRGDGGEVVDGGEVSASTVTPTSTTSIAAALEPPVGALGLPTTPTQLMSVSGESETISVATCPGLLVASPADSCVQIEHDTRSYAMTLTGQDNGAVVDVFEFVTSGSGITATKLLSGEIESPELPPNSTHTISISSAPTAVSQTFVIQSLIEGDSPPSGRVEFIAIGGENELTTVGVITDDPTLVGAADGYVFVTADQYDGGDPCCVSAVLITTIYPVESGWQFVAEVLDPDEADRRTADVTPVIAEEPVVVRGPEPVTTIAESTTTAAPALVAPGAVGGLVVDVDCDGSWLTVVASAPLVNVELELDRNPGGRVLRTAESCLSLNPTFDAGAYAGQSIYIVFYGPFATRFAAQEQCLNLGKVAMTDCYVAPLTNDRADRSVRFGPTD